MRMIAGVGLALLLSACGERAPQQNASENGQAAMSYQARIAAMPEAQRNAVFIRALRDAGRDCQNVKQSTFNGTQNGWPVWSVQCQDGAVWAIAIGENGIAQIGAEGGWEGLDGNASLP